MSSWHDASNLPHSRMHCAGVGLSGPTPHAGVPPCSQTHLQVKQLREAVILQPSTQQRHRLGRQLPQLCCQLSRIDGVRVIILTAAAVAVCRRPCCLLCCLRQLPPGCLVAQRKGQEGSCQGSKALLLAGRLLLLLLLRLSLGRRFACSNGSGWGEDLLCGAAAAAC